MTFDDLLWPGMTFDDLWWPLIWLWCQLDGLMTVLTVSCFQVKRERRTIICELLIQMWTTHGRQQTRKIKFCFNKLYFSWQVRSLTFVQSQHNYDRLHKRMIWPWNFDLNFFEYVFFWLDREHTYFILDAKGE